CAHSAQPGLVVQMATSLRRAGLAGVARSLPPSAPPKRALPRAHPSLGHSDPSALAEATRRLVRFASYPGRTAPRAPAPARALDRDHQTHLARCAAEQTAAPTQTRLLPAAYPDACLRAARDGLDRALLDGWRQAVRLPHGR